MWWCLFFSPLGWLCQIETLTSLGCRPLRASVDTDGRKCFGHLKDRSERQVVESLLPLCAEMSPERSTLTGMKWKVQNTSHNPSLLLKLIQSQPDPLNILHIQGQDEVRLVFVKVWRNSWHSHQDVQTFQFKITGLCSAAQAERSECIL